VQVANFIHCVIFAFAQKLWLVYANFIFSGLAMLGYSIMSDFISDSVPPEVISDYNPKPYELMFSPPPEVISHRNSTQTLLTKTLNNMK
jgi:hypothetical protein